VAVIRAVVSLTSCDVERLPGVNISASPSGYSGKSTAYSAKLDEHSGFLCIVIAILPHRAVPTIMATIHIFRRPYVA
jgi:hypothetical protein